MKDKGKKQLRPWEKIHLEIRRRRTTRFVIEIIIMIAAIIYMVRDLYHAGEFDFLFK